jgi:hypothetical protein
LRALADQFPERLMIVPFSDFELWSLRAEAHGSPLHRSEYFTIGNCLAHACEIDVEGALWPPPEHVLRVGAWPKNAFGWIRQTPVGINEWMRLDIAGMQALKQLNREHRQAQERRAIEALSKALEGKDKE